MENGGGGLTSNLTSGLRRNLLMKSVVMGNEGEIVSEK
jgi:hypothetical protein